MKINKFKGDVAAVNIKQQKQIKAFLIEEFGKEHGGALFSVQEKTLDEIIKNTENKSENQMKTLVQTILPRIALYKALSECKFPELQGERGYECMKKYMLKVVAAQKHASTAKMEYIPCFYTIYSKVFLKIMRMSDLWESMQYHDKDHFGADITKCLWHTACLENGCAELCSLFCDVDDVTYGGLRKMGFTRTKTLGYGGNCCDFRFFRK